jgi:hypothetical protein
MPPPERRDLRQIAELYTPATKDKFNQLTYNPPVEISCRWNWHRTVLNQDTRTPIVIDAEIAVSQSVPENSIMRLMGSDLLVTVYDCLEAKDIKGNESMFIVRAQRSKSTVKIVGS